MKEKEQFFEDIKKFNLHDPENFKKYIAKQVRREFWIRKEYKLTSKEYNIILESQDGVCAICKKRETHKDYLSIDHCHKTNKIRGLLCSGCNKALGFFNDDIEILKNAIEYLSKV